MKFKIQHEIKGRMRIHIFQENITFQKADMLQYHLLDQSFITSVKVYERTGNVAISYLGDRTQVIRFLKKIALENLVVPEHIWQNSGRKVNREYWDKLIYALVSQVGRKYLLPGFVGKMMILLKSAGYIYQGLRYLYRGKIEVPVLDATAIAVSVWRGDFKTAGSIMFLLGIGEILEEWTHKKSVEDLARSMSLNISKVWLLSGEQEVLTEVQKIQKEDVVVIHMGNMIPFDGIVIDGSGAVNQSSITGEGISVSKEPGGYVYAGTVLEEGQLKVQVKETAGSNKYEKIVSMIEETEKLKSSMEGKAEHLADKLVPYTLLGTGLTYLLTGNVEKALSVLMVDFSCALKLAMPICVLSAIKEASDHKITVKGGRFLEEVAAADTIVFDKTGTLTKATPTLVDVVPFVQENPDELLRLAACLEEHFPHSMARAVVNAALEKGLTHEEKHSKVEYIVAHGISSVVDGKKVLIGSRHFIFEDEKCVIPSGMQEKFAQLPEEYSHLYLAVEGVLTAALSIADPLRKEAPEVIKALKEAGFSRVVMMTGDSEKTASSIAKRVGIDEFYAEVLPEEKARFIEQQKAEGRTVIMVGDGINDSPSLSVADVGIAINDGAQIAREIADITIDAGDLYELVLLKAMSMQLTKRIKRNYHGIIGINSALILLGVLGAIQPTFSALLHNVSTLAISLNSMQDLLDEKKLRERGI